MQELKYDIRKFTSPLALLEEIISDQEADIFDLPINEISTQYLRVLEENSQNGLDMDLASEFILMAASLLEIKTKMLLPDVESSKPEEPDVRTDLVLQLMAYRRMKNLAIQLEAKHEEFAYSVLRPWSGPQCFGLAKEYIAEELSLKKFERAAERLAKLNYQKLQQHDFQIKRLIKPEVYTVRDAIKKLFTRLKEKGRALFQEIFPPESAAGERVAAFLGILELNHRDKIRLEQSQHLGPIEIYHGGSKDD